MPAEDRPTSYRIGDLTLDLLRRNVRRRGELLPCGKLTFDLLVLLADRAPGVVSRGEIAERLWEGRFVSPATVKQRVSLLRQALGDRADDPHYIDVVRGQGYMLVPTVQPLYAKPSRTGWRRLALAAVVPIAFVVGAEIGYREGLTPRIPDLAESASILVTSWPAASGDAAEFGNELPQEDYLFVLGVAEQIFSVLTDSNFVSRFDATFGRDSAVGADESLAVVANASNRDHDTLSVSVALLRNSLSDNRLARVYAVESRLRALETAPGQERSSSRLASLPIRFRNKLAAFLHSDIKTAVSHDNRFQMFLPGGMNDGEFMLIASFNFRRSEIQEHAPAIQAEAARMIAMAISEQVPGMEL